MTFRNIIFNKREGETEGKTEREKKSKSKRKRKRKRKRNRERETNRERRGGEKGRRESKRFGIWQFFSQKLTNFLGFSDFESL